jgi:hypothetical protein
VTAVIADHQARAATADDAALERRLTRSMCAAAALAVLISAFVAPWRVTTGLALGGALSLVNHRWLSASIAAAFGGDLTGKRPRLKIARYVLRYFVVGLTVFAAARLELISVPAAVAGLCSFVPAVFVEAARQFYIAIVHREET